MNRHDRLIARARQGYRLEFGSDGPEPRRFACAPGRVNLIGEHVDYNEGFVLPAAIDRETIVAFGSGPEIGGKGYVEAVAIDMGQGRDKVPLYEQFKRTQNNWQNLLRGVVASLQAGGHEVLPAQLTITGDVPVGAGLSSSASFAVALTMALARVSNIALSKEEIALIAQTAETDYLGTACGIMDQMASSAGREGHAVLIDCRSLEHMAIPVSPDLALMIIDSGIRRELVSSAFNNRRRECEAAAQHLKIKALRDIALSDLASHHATMDPVLFKRARHVVSEIARIEPTATALAKGDAAVLAETLHHSHVSLRDDFEVTIPPVDRLVETIAAALGTGADAAGGVRMTGAGFGGCLVALVRKGAVDAVRHAVEETYNATADVPASVNVHRFSGGARIIVP